MVKKEQHIQKADFFDSNKDQILNKWIDELKHNKQFNQDDIVKKQNLLANINQFFSDVLHTVDTEKQAVKSIETFQPIVKLWHRVLKTQIEKGFSTKDTAMLIFSLKKAVMAFVKEQFKKEPYNYSPELGEFNSLLDLLGVLTFEVYSAENDLLLRRKNQQINYLETQRSATLGKIIGNSPQIRAVYKAIGLVLENDVTVLLQGESGTGKDLIANTIHQNSKRKDKPFITVNCGAIPKDLSESELFGHEKGAFTSAENRRLGKFELAQDGTLFLDEVGELPLETQVKLLRALQNREIERVGGTESISINVRVIAASNKDLNQAVKDKKFRLDLFYRLNVFPVLVPPLRDRKEDILPLAYFFLEKYSKQYKTNGQLLSQEAEAYLLEQLWPGNIRELDNLMQRATILAPTEIITKDILRLTPGQEEHLLIEDKKIETPANNLSKIIPLEDLEAQAIKKALDINKGNIKKTAQDLKISRATLYNKMSKYKIDG
jgi:two-component system, NtrC family, response regulator AtoC